MQLDDPFDQGHADPGFFGPGIQPFEELKDLVVIGRLDAIAVVTNVEDRLLPVPLRPSQGQERPAATIPS